MRGHFTPDEVYALTAYLFAINKMIPEDQVLDQDNLAKIKMPIGDEWGCRARLIGSPAEPRMRWLPLLASLSLFGGVPARTGAWRKYCATLVLGLAGVWR